MILSLTDHPLTVATVTQKADLDFLEGAGIVTAEVLEFRLDNLFDSAEAATKVMRTVENPALLTVRRADEGGASDIPDETRLALYSQQLDAVELIDTEISSLESSSFAGFADIVQKADVKLVASFHDFESWPGIDVIKAKVDAAYELGAEVPKIAIVIDEMKDLFTLAQLVEFHRSEGRLISAMGMGPLGKVSRLLLAKAGSCLNYGYLHTPNAPGQWSADDLKRLIAAL